MKTILKPKNYLTFLLLSMGIFLQSCVKEEYDLSQLEEGNWSPDIALPLVYTNFSINDIVLRTDKNGNITLDGDNFCTLVYNGTLFSINAEDFIVLPNQSNATSFTISAAEQNAFNALPVNSAFTISRSQNINFQPGSTNSQIDSILFASGLINFQINKTFSAGTTVQIGIPSAKKSGLGFFDTFGVGPGTTNRSFNLAGYSLNLKDSTTGHNKFKIYYAITLTKIPGSSLPAGTSINFTQDIVNQKFQTVFGYIGMQSNLTPNQDTVAISIFKHNNSPIGIGTFHFADPLLKMYLTNSFGLPVSISNIDLKWYNPGFGQGNIFFTPTPFQVKAPTFVGGAEVSDTLKLNNSNSNFNAAMDNRPKYIIYNVSSLTNPLTMPAQTNFVDAGSKLKANVEVVLPMFGNAKDFTFEDTVKFKFEKVDNIESILFKAFAVNDFPMGISMQVYFTDSVYNTIDSLFNEVNVLPSATVSFLPSGLQTSVANQKITDVFFTRARALALKNAKYIIIRAVSATFDEGTKNVKIYSDRRLSVKLGARAKMNIKIK
jgi:hypothetical protein